MRRNSYFLIVSAIISVLCQACATSTNGPILKQASRAERAGQIYLEGGTTNLFEGNYTEALKNFLEAAKYSPESPEVWNNLGLAYYGKNEISRAKDSWEHALSIDKEYSDARINLGAMYLNQGKLEEAEIEFKKVLKDLVYSKTHQAYYNLGLLYLKQNKKLLAEQQFKLAVQNNSSYCEAWLRLANIQKDKGDHQEALDSFRNATKGQCYSLPGADQVHFEIASEYLKIKDIPSAKAKFLEVIEHFPQSEWARRAEVNLNSLRRE